MATTKRKPRSPRPSPITDSVIVELMLEGRIVIENEFTQPIVYKDGKRLTLELNEQGGSRRIHGGKRYRVKIHYRGEQRRIMLSRLLWLWFFLAIPPEHEIHHRNEIGTEDRIGNLECWHTDKHKQHHYGGSDDGDF